MSLNSSVENKRPEHYGQPLGYARRPADINLVIGTNVQAFSARLSEVASIGTSLQQIRVNAGATALEYFTPSASGATLGANTFTDLQTVAKDDSATAVVTNLLDLQHSSSGTPAASFGAGIRFGLESTTTANQDAAAINAVWTTATHASRTSQLQFGVVGNATAINPLTVSAVNSGTPGNGVDIKSTAAGAIAGVTFTVTSTGSNENISFVPKGTGSTVLGGSTISFGSYLNTAPGLTVTGNELYTTNGVGGCCTGFRTNDVKFIANNPATTTTWIDGNQGSRSLIRYNSVNTAGWGLPVIYAAGRVTAQSAANASIATYTVGSADGSFEVSANMNVTAATSLATTLTCTYTDESNTARTMIFPVQQVSGSFIAAGAITGTGAWATPVLHIRAKASTAITILTSTGTFTGVTYTAEGIIKQMS